MPPKEEPLDNEGKDNVGELAVVNWTTLEPPGAVTSRKVLLSMTET